MKQIVILVMAISAIATAQVYDTVGGFPEGGDDRGIYSYLSDGEFSIAVISDSMTAVIANENVPVLSDVSISVVASQSTQEFDSLYGLSCRIQENSERYNFLVSNVDLFYTVALTKINDEGMEDFYILAEGLLPEDGFIGNELLRADCIGDKLSFYVNKKLVAEVTDNTYSEGLSGLTVSSAKEFTGIAIVVFEDFTAEAK